MSAIGEWVDRGHRSWQRLRWLRFSRPRERTIELIKAKKKQAQQFSATRYNESPRVSVIVQSFNQVRNVALLESRLRATCMDELIVCEDGSIDGSLEEWLKRLQNPNDFLIRSNDLHEIRAYHRAIGYARGEIICLMQDDDQPPKDGSWLARAVDLFRAHPRLAMLGGWVGFMNWFDEEYNAPWSAPERRRIPYEDPQTRQPFMFMENVNIGPYLIRKDAYAELGGFNHDFSEPGAPGICFESEICYRAWERGWQAALTDLPVKAPVDGKGYIMPGGTLLWGNEERHKNERLNKQLIYKLHGAQLQSIQAKVRAANKGLRARAALAPS